MTFPTEQFPYVSRDPALGSASLAPMLPLTLVGPQNTSTSALVDSGAAINVLPYSLGVQLGFGGPADQGSGPEREPSLC
jgi:hypothetical protein